ncbi:MAG: JAB domain-containing protein [Bacteroidales bacterium]|jgi:DNA repair protein RadC
MQTELSFGEIDLSHLETSTELAEIKVIYKSENKNKVKITNSKDVFNILNSLYDKDTIGFQEQFYMLLLNKGNVLLGWIKLSTGGISGTVVDLKIIFATALKAFASGIVVSHNHPSTNVNPSNEDVSITKKINDAGKLFEIKLLDHIIVAPDNTYFSFADEGIL